MTESHKLIENRLYSRTMQGFYVLVDYLPHHIKTLQAALEWHWRTE